MFRVFLSFQFLALMILGIAAGECGARADWLAIPGKARIELIDLSTISKDRVIDLRGNGTPALAAHPSAPILASVIAGGGLAFWNTPSFTEASKASDPLFDDVTELAFSSQGDKLFMLNPVLRAVLVFGLQTSKLESIYPVPGGEPVELEVNDRGLMVSQKDGLTVLEPSTGVLLGQWRLGGPVAGVLLYQNRLVLASAGESGLACFNPVSGVRLSSVGGDGGYGRLCAFKGNDFFAFCSTSQTLESWLGSGKIAWTAHLAKDKYDLFTSKDKKWLYALARQGRMLSVFDSATGRKLGGLPVAEAMGRAVEF